MAYDDEDWIKYRTWDVRNTDGSLVTTLDQLCHGRPSLSKIRGWQDLTCWLAAPPELKAEVDAYLKENDF